MTRVKKETPGQLADQLRRTQQRRIKLKQQVDDLATVEAELKRKLLVVFEQQHLTEAAGRISRVSVTYKPVPRTTDWDRVFRYVSRTRSFDLLQRRLTVAAVRERWENGKSIPGVEAENVPVFSVRKKP